MLNFQWQLLYEAQRQSRYKWINKDIKSFKDVGGSNRKAKQLNLRIYTHCSGKHHLPSNIREIPETGQVYMFYLRHAWNPGQKTTYLKEWLYCIIMDFYIMK